MIDQITIENFKAIGARVTVPIKPITLLFGPNGAGKSSILHALFYLREILERNNLDAGYTLTCGDRIDLGGFRNFVHARDLSRAVTISLRFQYEAGSNHFDGYEVTTSKSTSDYYIGNCRPCTVTTSVSLPANMDSPIATYTVSYDDEPMFTVTLHQPTRGVLRIDSFNCRHPLLPSIAGEGFHHDQLLAFYKKAYDAEEVAPGIVSFSWDGYGDFRATDFHVKTGDSELPTYNGMNHMQIFGTFFTFAIRAARDLINQMIAVGPLRDSPPRGQIGSNRPSSDPARWYSGVGAWDYLLRGETWTPDVNPLTGVAATDEPDLDFDLVHHVSEALKGTLDTGFSLLREEVRYYVESTTEKTGNFLFSERLRSFAKQIGVLSPTELQAAYQEDVLQQMGGLKSEKRLILHDHRAGIDVAPHDIGVGISQVLPVVTAALSSHPLVVIEQPELHIHPRMQVALGDVLLDGLKTEARRLESKYLKLFGSEFADNPELRNIFLSKLKTNGKQLIIETHSEHLVLRLLRRIREGAFSPEDLAVVYVDPGDGEPGARSTKALRLRVDADGEFRDRWPHGFFEERSPEVFG